MKLGLIHSEMPEEFRKRVRVFCDGQEVKHCYAADDKQGWAVHLWRDATGAHLNERGELINEIVTGQIEVRTEPL